MKSYLLLISHKTNKNKVFEKEIAAKDIESLFKYFRENYKDYRISWINNAGVLEMSKLRYLETKVLI
jgi:hypothetical protein